MKNKQPFIIENYNWRYVAGREYFDKKHLLFHHALGYGDWSNGSFCCSACSNYLLGKSKTK